MGLIKYGASEVRVSDETLFVISHLIGEIVRAGATEWVSLSTTDPEGAMDFLISPGIPVTIIYDSPYGSKEHINELLSRYLPKEPQARPA